MSEIPTHRLSGKLATVVAVLLAVVGPATAHSGHQEHDAGAGFHPAVPASIFVASVLVLGTAVYLDHVDKLPRRMADAAVALGVVGLLVSVALFFV